MRVTINREPKDYKIAGTVFKLKPASKDDISENYRSSLYEMQHGDSMQLDPHLFEKNLLKKHIVGWDETLQDENDAVIPFGTNGMEKILNYMDQNDRDAIYQVIVSPSQHRAKLVALEKNV